MREWERSRHRHSSHQLRGGLAASAGDCPYCYRHAAEMGTTSSALLASIAAATGEDDYAARIGLDARRLRELAATRFREMPSGRRLRRVCAGLHSLSSKRAVVVDGSMHPESAFNDDDAKVIGHFLAKASARRHRPSNISLL